MRNMAIASTMKSIIFLSAVGIICSQTITVSQLGCSYSFEVPDKVDGACPAASSDGIMNSDASSAIIRNQQYQLAQLTQTVLELQEEMAIIKSHTNTGSNVGGDVKIGTNYIRWGRKSCPDTAVLIYEGYSAKSHVSHSGGGSNYICLDKNPQWLDVTTAGFQGKSYIYGVEYETLTGLDTSIVQDDAPCAVCHVDGRGEHLMIPGNRTCPSSWTKEYEGLLVSQEYKQTKATYNRML